jgi:hypothetical protein
MKPVTHFDLAGSATSLAANPKLNSADKSEAIRLAQLRSFTRKDKESLSALKSKYRL